MRAIKRATAFAVLLPVFLLTQAGYVHAQPGIWNTLTPMPTARTYAPSGVVNGKFIVTGGCCILLFSSPYTRVSSTEIYDPLANSWQIMQSIPVAVHAAGNGVIGSKLYVAGGSVDQITSDTDRKKLQVYDPSSNSWGNGASMPLTLEQAASGVINGKLYLAGGARFNGDSSNTLYKYDPATDQWSSLANMPTARVGAAAAVFHDKLYVIGGLAGPNNVAASYLSVVEVYDPVHDTWTAEAPAPTARYQAGAGMLGDILYVVGGQGYPAIALDTVESYNPSTNSWSTSPHMPSPNVGPSVAAINNILYVAGGATGSGASTTLDNFLYSFTSEMAKVQQPINPDGSSIFSATRGIIPVKFALLLGGNPTCSLPPRHYCTNPDGRRHRWAD